MNAQIESLIEYYLTRNGETGIFLCPQYCIKNANTSGRAEPDFVALDFRNKKVIVVEVSIKSEIAKLAEKVRHRQSNWFEPLMQHLVREHVIPDPTTSEKDGHWEPRFLGFVRLKENAVKREVDKFAADAPQVKYVDLEDAILAYDYWDKELP